MLDHRTVAFDVDAVMGVVVEAVVFDHVARGHRLAAAVDVDARMEAAHVAVADDGIHPVVRLDAARLITLIK